MKIDVEEVAKSNYTLEDVLVLIELEYSRRGKKFPYSSTKKEQYVDLYKRGILTASTEGYKISVEGFQELRKIIGMTPLKLENSTVKKDFNEFWETYPISDGHGPWLRTRGLKSNKINCEKVYSMAIRNGTKHDDIIKALKWEIKDRKQNSIQSNKMSFMKNSYTWLNQREYEIIKESMDNEEDSDDDFNWTEDIV